MAEEAEEWMRQNAPWKDRPEELRRHLAEKYGVRIPDRHAREALKVLVVTDPNEVRRRRAAMNKASSADAKQLVSENVSRVSRGLSERSSIPKYRSAREATRKEIVAQRGPIVELRFEHGEDIWYARWLEIARGGRFGIINKAVEYFAPKMMAHIQQIANLKQFNITAASETQSEADRFARHVLDKDIEFLEFGTDRVYEPWSEAKQATVRVRRQRERAYQKSLRDIETYDAGKESKSQAQLDWEEKKRREAASVRTFRPGRK